jgi:DNA-binding response OmpR family regulator
MTARTTQQRVLVVDDEGDIRVIVGLNLGLAGMEFGEARDGGEALEFLRTGNWDACILDLAMPNVDGFDVLRSLSEEGIVDRIAVIVLSAKGTPAVAIEAMQLGAHAHLTKPFSPAAVAQTVEELIALSPEERRKRREEAIDRAGTLSRLGVGTV